MNDNNPSFSNKLSHCGTSPCNEPDIFPPSWYFMTHFSQSNNILFVFVFLIKNKKRKEGSLKSKAQIWLLLCVFVHIYGQLRWLCDGPWSPEHEYKKSGNCSKNCCCYAKHCCCNSKIPVCCFLSFK